MRKKAEEGNVNFTDQEGWLEDQPPGQILACNKCADLASDTLIAEILESKDPALLKHKCKRGEGGRFSLMTKPQAFAIALAFEFPGYISEE